MAATALKTANVKEEAQLGRQPLHQSFLGFPIPTKFHCTSSSHSIHLLVFFHLIDSLSIFRPHVKNTLTHKHTQTAPHSCFNLKYKVCIF